MQNYQYFRKQNTYYKRVYPTNDDIINNLYKKLFFIYEINIIIYYKNMQHKYNSHKTYTITSFSKICIKAILTLILGNFQEFEKNIILQKNTY